MEIERQVVMVRLSFGTVEAFAKRFHIEYIGQDPANVKINASNSQSGAFSGQYPAYLVRQPVRPGSARVAKRGTRRTRSIVAASYPGDWEISSARKEPTTPSGSRQHQARTTFTVNVTSRFSPTSLSTRAKILPKSGKKPKNRALFAFLECVRPGLGVPGNGRAAGLTSRIGRILLQIGRALQTMHPKPEGNHVVLVPGTETGPNCAVAH